jgi:hypothetical protein
MIDLVLLADGPRLGCDPKPRENHRIGALVHEGLAVVTQISYRELEPQAAGEVQEVLHRMTRTLTGGICHG